MRRRAVFCLMLVPCISFCVSCAHPHASEPAIVFSRPPESPAETSEVTSQVVESHAGDSESGETNADRELSPPHPAAETPPLNNDAILKTSHEATDGSRGRLAGLPPVPEDVQAEAADAARSAAKASSVSLSLADLEQLAEANNPTLVQLSMSVDKAYAVRRQVGLCPNPTVGYFAEEMGDDGTAGKQGGFVTQTIVLGNKLDLNRAVAGQDVQVMLWELEAQRQRVLTDVRVTYFDTLGAQRRVEQARLLLQVAEAGVEAAEELVRAQQAARPDVLQAEILLNETRIILQNAVYDYEAAWKRVASLVGRPDLEPVALQGSLEGELTARDWEQTYQELLASSPELQAAQSRVNRARTQIRRQQVQPIPNLFAQVVVAHDNASGDDIANVQLGIPLPLFNRNQGGIGVAEADYRRAIRDVERIQLQLRTRLASAMRNYQRALKQAERYRNDILPRAKENLDLTEQGYLQAEFDFLRVLTARRTYFETNLAYIQSLTELLQADAVIQGLLLAGGLDEVPDVSPGILGGLGQRGQALSGQ